MSIKLNTPKSVTIAKPTSVDALDVIVVEFLVRRPTMSIVNELTVAVKWAYGNRDPVTGEFDIYSVESIEVRGLEARNFLANTVNGKLGLSIEEEVLAALVAVGRIPDGVVEDEDI